MPADLSARRGAFRGALLLSLLGACTTAPSPAPSSEAAVPALRLEPLAERVPRRASFDVEHYALALELWPERRALEGVARLRLLALADLREVGLDLEGLDASSARDALGRALELRQEPGRVVLTLPEPLRAGQRVELELRYGGVPRKGLYFVAERDGVPTRVFTQGECEDSRWWFPCFDEPAERATSEIVVGMPRAWRALAAGELVERLEQGERAHERWRMSEPHPSYLTTLVAGELAWREAAWSGVPLVYAGPPEREELLEPTFARTPEVLEFLSRWTGVRYPYAKYAQACVEEFPFGGMENVSASTLTVDVLRDERGRRDRPPEGLIVHEAAHQWFGDLLTCASWSEIWLNEGFATYAGAAWTEAQEGADAYRAAMRAIQDAYVQAEAAAAPRAMLHARYRDPMDLFFSGHAYQGGAARLHLLRFVVGEQAFRRGLRAYAARNRNRAVTTDDLRASMEQASGLELADFFEQWFRRPGHPELEVQWRHDPGRGRLGLSVRQVQDVVDGTPAVFRTPVEVEIHDSRGSRRVRLSLEKRQEIFDLEAPERPVWVRFDKGGWIPKRLRETKDPEEWLAILAADDDANGRLDALAALGELARGARTVSERARLVEALARAVASDPLPALRARAATALSGVREGVGRDALEAAARADESAAVRVAALEALAACGPDAGRERLGGELYEQGYSWRTMAAAAELELAAAGEPAAGLQRYLARLDAAASPHGELEAALLERLAGRGEPAVLERLLARAEAREPRPVVRAAALRLLAEPARTDARARALLEEALTERDPRVRRAALDALAKLADPEAKRLLAHRHAASVDVRERRALEAALGAGEAREQKGASR